MPKSVMPTFELISIFRQYVSLVVPDPAGSLDDCGRPFIWNWANWHRAILKMAGDQLRLY